MKGVYIRTFGCQMNVHDSERIAGVWSAMGYTLVDEPAKAQVAIVNTCAVREKPEEKVFSELGRLRRWKTSGRLRFIGVAGCVAQKQGAALLRRAPFVDFVIGPRGLPSLNNLIPLLEKGHSGIVLTPLETPHQELKAPALRQPGVRAWVTIMEGCDNFCSYCVVPYVRGREESRIPQDIVNEVCQAVDEGYKEVVLLGQNVNSYGKNFDPPTDFPTLLREVARLPGLTRLRFVTSHPKDFSSSLVEVMASEPAVCEQIHLPLQAGSSRVLEAMNRGYTMDDYRQKISLLREELPNAALSTDLIVGFPGESNHDFQETIRAVEEIGFDSAFSFAYSPREGTKAASFEDDIPREEKLSRLQKLQDVIRRTTSAKMKSQVGRILEILVEGPSPRRSSWMTGRDRTNRIVHFPASQVLPGETIKVIITDAYPNCLAGRVADSR